MFITGAYTEGRSRPTTLPPDAGRLQGRIHMTAPAEARSLEHQLMNHLKFSGLKQDHLTELVNTVVQASGLGLHPHNVTPLGTVNPEGITMRTTVEAANLDRITKLLLNIPRIDNIVVFPRGIPAVTKVQLELNIR